MGHNLTSKEILTCRAELKKEIAEMLEETNSDFSVDDVINAVYNEEESDDYQHVIAMFDDGNIDNLSDALELVMDVWNYFPHKALGGLSPQEKLMEHKSKRWLINNPSSLANTSIRSKTGARPRSSPI